MKVDRVQHKLVVKINLMSPEASLVREAPATGTWKGAEWHVEPTAQILDYFRGKGDWSSEALGFLETLDNLQQYKTEAAQFDFQYKTTPFDHQHTIFHNTRNEKVFALFMEQGTGKSKVIIDTASWLFAQGLIDAVYVTAWPNGAQENWVNKEIPVHTPDFVPWKACAWKSTVSTRKWWIKDHLDPVMEHTDGELHWFCMNSDGLSTKRASEVAEKFIRAHHSVLFVADESTAFKNHASKRTKSATRLAQLTEWNRILTGTPITKSPLDLYGQFGLLDKSILGWQSFPAFRSTYAVMKPLYNMKDRRGRQIEVVDGYQNLDHLVKTTKPYTVRVLKEECLDLPKKLYKREYVELTTKQKKVYVDIQDRLISEFEEGEITVQIALTKMLRLHQVCMNFVRLDGEEKEQAIEPGEHPRLKLLRELTSLVQGKGIIWAPYRYSLQEIENMLAEVYGERSVVHHWGKTTPEQRVTARERFQEDDECRWIVGNPRALGYVYTLTSGSYSFYYGNGYSLEQRLQSEDRLHRIGQTRNVLYTDIECPGTIDTKIIETLIANKDIADSITGDQVLQWLRT